MSRGIINDKIFITLFLAMLHFTTPNTSGQKNSCNYIIVHHTGTGASTSQGIINSRKKPGGLSCHYLVDEAGQVYSFNTEKDVLRHAGEGDRGAIHDTMNFHAIGIEVVGPLTTIVGEQFTDAQRKAVAILIKDIATRNGIKKENILRHKDYAPTRKVDIYDAFWNTTHETRSAYIQSIFDDGEKPKLVKLYMETGSKLWGMCNDETKKRLEEMNDYFRSQGF